MLPAPPKPSPRRWRRSAQYSTEVRTIATGSRLPSPVWSGPKHGSLPVCEYEPTPPLHVPPIPTAAVFSHGMPEGGGGCRSCRSFALECGRQATQHSSTAAQLHSCTRMSEHPGGQDLSLSPHPHSKTVQLFPKFCFPNFILVLPKPIPQSLPDSPSAIAITASTQPSLPSSRAGSPVELDPDLDLFPQHFISSHSGSGRAP